MPSTTPNKETVRRICHLQGAKKCYLFIKTDDDFIEVLTDVSNEKLHLCAKELEQWAGMKFRVYNFKSNCEKVSMILENGETLLPIKF